MRRWSRLPWAMLLLGATTLGCGGARTEVKAALTGTLPELQQTIAQAQQGGTLDGLRLRQLAHAVAEREIASAQGADGAQQLAVFRPCLTELETALDERAARGDEVAAVATLLLFEAGKRPAAELVSRYQRPTAARFGRSQLAHLGGRPSRFAPTLLYGSGRARAPWRLRSGREGASFVAADRARGSSAARSQPSESRARRPGRRAHRQRASRAGTLDLFTAGDEQQQLAVLDAWSEAPSFQRGGERELSHALSRSGLVAVSAATLLLRSPDSRAAAIAVLAHAIAEGDDDARRSALMMAPLSEPSVKNALEKAAKNPSPELTPLVLSRLLELPSASPDARAKLEKLAQDKSDYGLEASYELARLGSAAALARVEHELSHEHASHRPARGDHAGGPWQSAAARATPGRQGPASTRHAGLPAFGGR